ncbi:dynein light chain Tctex-type protein 2 isoform X2 [Passer montanus]|uniref:dynein light chain Tctex-type protein 2 isoform X2 n=1 Tax=Passer montanus TaxID=9160 RepID=UPI0019605266|nr:dynein light chain Tctex-type protein 2 isoform X2 [Passer montanus]
MEGGKKRQDKDTSKGKKTPQDASGTAPTEGKAKPKNRNTYRLEPRTKVQDGLLRDKAQAILTNKLQEATYDGASSPFLCASISEEILNAVKELDYDRYKYVVSVLIVEKANQAMIQLDLFEVLLKLLCSLWVIVSRGDNSRCCYDSA